MSDKSYDAVVVGGGHHGLIIACYLQRAGMKTGIFELQSKLGGAVTSEGGPVPEFRLNPGANWTRFYGHPAYTDFNLREKGLEYIFPDENEAMIFDNDTCLVGYSAFTVVDPLTGKTERSDQNLQKTLNEISRFSKKDVETAEELFRRYVKKWKSAMGKYRFSPPVPWGKKNELERLCDDPKDGFDPIYQFMTSQQLAYDLFESEELRTLFIRASMTSFGGAPDDVIGLHGLVHSLGLVLSWEPAAIAKGGSQSVTNALQKAFTEMGGEFFVRSEVVKLLVENGKAKGIRLRDGTEIRAKGLVVSDLSALQTIQMIGEENVDSKIVRRVKNIRYNRHNVIWAVLAMHELPRYKAASFNPDCGPQPRLYMGPRNADYMANQYLSEILVNGISSKLFMFVGTDTIWDKSRAPEGKHMIGVEEFAAPTRFFSPGRWQELRKEFEDAIIKQWQIYAPNMTRDNIIGCRVFTPYDIELRRPNMHQGSIAVGDMIVSQMDRFRPTPEMSSYRTPIKNVYICSAATHNGVGTGRGCSYNCYQTILKDFGLKK
ncbi:MAG: NAD(P)/FAD-dependent oxidoreductase [Deltaproteobacteria bacterium]|nr:NAD(P)/FAD-dependent oxidoreductase [Deltaproteobacteria bacterium]